ncbi:YqgE/AlgH family protein [Streptomyces sp. NPDC051322]|uniref:YqgE/AlgH family protein n=1 Tax=Streptomyces sp. NPDC051322 TaxID=3154645 RepID=UPI00344F7C54
MSVMTEVSSLTGRLLIATPALADPNFDRAVVLVLDHDGEGSLGVILNRPTPVGVGDILAGWEQLAGEPGVIFQGGPVALDSALGVAVIPGVEGPAVTPRRSPWSEPSPTSRFTSGSSGPSSSGPLRSSSEDPIGWRRVRGAIGVVDLETPPELLAAALGSLRIFAGYAGWGPGQLESELTEGAWYVVDSEPGDVACPEPDGMWRAVLRRQRSKLAMIATYPDDPSLN